MRVAPVRGKLLVEAARLQRHQPTRLGVQLDIAPGWHIYGQNPGDAGLATQLTVQVQGATLGEFVWPAAQIFHENDQVTTYGYTDEVMAAAPLVVNEEAASVEVAVHYLACNVTCNPGQLSLKLALTPSAPDAAATPRHAAFAAYEARLTQAPGPLAGSSARPATAADRHSWWQLLQVLFAAFVGGVLLNAMPCVLPVLALKAVGLAQHATSPKRARRHALAYTLGVVASLQVLALLVLLLRALGHEVGWGFQFQQPVFVAAVAVALVVFAANCLGAFTLTPELDRLSQAHDKARGSLRDVLEGVLAVVVATPCSAPFLGASVAFALAQGAAVVAATFAAMGLGLAAPYVLLATFPGSRRLLPAPGPWMEGLKTALGYALLATAAWLAWVLTRAQGSDALAALLLLAWIAAVGANVLGVVLRRLPHRGGVGLTCLAAVLVALGGQLWPLLEASEADSASNAGPTANDSATGELAMAPYSAEAVQQALAAGRPVFVDFTADWCVTCKYNERTVLADDRIRAAFAKRRVTVLRADWTRRDEAILRTLQAHGRAAVPMYLLYFPDQAAPKLLPEVLTVRGLLRALDNR